MEIDLENVSKKELLALLSEAQKTIFSQDRTISIQENEKSNLGKNNSKLEKNNSKLEKNNSKLEQDCAKLVQEKAELQRLVDLLRRMQFGQKRERFEDPNQISLPLDVAPEELEKQEEVLKEEITYSRTKKKHPGRAKLPDHLPVEEIEIHPQGDLSDLVCIGKETTDVLDYVPGHFKIKRYIRQICY